MTLRDFMDINWSETFIIYNVSDYIEHSYAGAHEY